jgi:hypothetical protein
MAPASRRQVLSPETLAAFGASPIYQENHSADATSSSSSTSQFSKYFAATTTSADEAPIIGIKIGGWAICTQNSSIGDEQMMEKLTVLLEEIANNNNNAPCQKVNNDDDDDEDVTKLQSQSAAVARQRRLCPPEITFLDAFISLRHEKKNDDNYDGETTTDDDTTSEIRFTARDALSEWAEAHTSLETQPTDESEHSGAQEEVLGSSSTLSNERKECRGVSILRTLDAKVWSNKPQPLTDTTTRSDSGGCGGGGGAAATHSSEFYYDWTFSSPYAGTILTNIHSSSSNKNISNDEHSSNIIQLINNRQQWQPLPQSQIPFHLLQDTSQPILLYDDIHLFEDDLHDNGETSLNIKIRVMPKCWYVLQRLFVRVDYVCVKCREVRYFCLLDSNDGTTTVIAANATGDVGKCKANTIYRDVTWREASWAELHKMNLPVDPSAWMEHQNGSGVGGSISTGIHSFAALLTKLPVVSTPCDLPKHSYFEG